MKNNIFVISLFFLQVNCFVIVRNVNGALSPIVSDEKPFSFEDAEMISAAEGDGFVDGLQERQKTSYLDSLLNSSIFSYFQKPMIVSEGVASPVNDDDYDNDYDDDYVVISKKPGRGFDALGVVRDDVEPDKSIDPVVADFVNQDGLLRNIDKDIVISESATTLPVLPVEEIIDVKNVGDKSIAVVADKSDVIDSIGSHLPVVQHDDLIIQKNRTQETDDLAIIKQIISKIDDGMKLGVALSRNLCGSVDVILHQIETIKINLNQEIKNRQFDNSIIILQKIQKSLSTNEIKVTLSLLIEFLNEYRKWRTIILADSKLRKKSLDNICIINKQIVAVIKLLRSIK